MAQAAETLDDEGAGRRARAPPAQAADAPEVICRLCGSVLSGGHGSLGRWRTSERALERPCRAEEGAPSSRARRKGEIGACRHRIA
jgi:hypothetical protein